MTMQQERLEDREITARELASSYDEIFSSPGTMRDADALYAWVLELLGPYPGARLLDVGCGEGTLVKLARENGVDALGVDLSMVGAKTAIRSISDDVIALADGECLPFNPETFNFLTIVGSLEHFPDPSQGVREIQRVLRNGGKAALVLPNSYYLADIIWHVWRTGYSVSHRQSLERFATFGEWVGFIQANGLKVVNAYKYNYRFPRNKADWRWYFQHPRKFIYLSLAPFIPFNLSYHFVFICTRG